MEATCEKCGAEDGLEVGDGWACCRACGWDSQDDEGYPTCTLCGEPMTELENGSGYQMACEPCGVFARLEA